MRFNLFFRHFISYAVIIISMTLIITLITSNQIKQSYLKTLEMSLQKQADIESINIKNLLLKGQYNTLDSIVNIIAQKTSTRITIIRNDGEVIAESDRDKKEMENHATRSEFIQALQTGVGKKIRYSVTTSQEMLYVAVAVKDNNRVIAVVRASSYLTQINKELGKINRTIIGSALILMVLALLLSALTSRNLTRPIRAIAEAAEKISNGDFGARIVAKRKDEVGQLTESVNNMAESLNQLFTTLQDEREEIKSIFASMAEGLVVLDNKDRITLANDIFKTIVNCADDSIKEKYYWEVVKSSQFSDFVRQVRQSSSHDTREIEYNNKTYSVSASMTSRTKDQKLIIVMRDITEAKNLEQIKADFIANVSHELKTPLTSIKGFADTLSDEIGKKYQKFAKIISRNADRLINIVHDLLVISVLERKEQKLQIEPIDLTLMFANLKKIFSHQLKAKKLQFTTAIADDCQFIQADFFLIEQVLTNLIDNAIKYNVEKGKINISVDKVGNNTRIIIKDTGIGIAEEHLARIFERFYVVDKSRFRKLGGTGLGLSIVKHIVLSHNGEISVESEINKGTSFTIILPNFII